MIEIETWMVRTALVIMTLYLADGALFFLHLWLVKRRKAMTPASRTTQIPQSQQDDAFAEMLG